MSEIVYFLCGWATASIISYFYCKRVVLLILGLVLFVSIEIIRRNSEYFQNWIANIYPITMLLALLFLHTFLMFATPLMMKVPRINQKNKEIGTRVFIAIFYIFTLFFLFMMFIKGVIY
ncbi:hypothetical protein SAMN05660772_02343 [Pasteurella testudinis DSM 23072]|uniref:Uncharacterized protein n=1 Tax=Pasteurella testudinis DSM 23072 TaxID=1122938 RepID=A0A1W1UUS8_9PAST|nr:hypothetical protein SAMN05660772_02343 [Pasteurella testudinis DSM 23072]SUB51270.1 Uncharacterised protein [Pasteurella testudinis]